MSGVNGPVRWNVRAWSRGNAARVARFVFVVGATLSTGGCAAIEADDERTEEADLGGATRLVLGVVEGATTTKVFAVSGAERATVPDTYQWSCGRAPHAYRSTSNVAWLELKNANPQTASVSLALSDPNARVFAYASRSTSLTSCLTFDTDGKLSGSKSVVVEANSSVFLLVATDSRTGAYSLDATVDHLAPTTNDVTLPAVEGATTTKVFAISGAERATVPDTYQWSCGRTPHAYRSTSNVAWLELKNANPQTASVSLALSDPNARVFAYASRSTSLTSCLTFDTDGKLSGSKSVVVEANSSVFLLVATDSRTGAYSLDATVDVLIDP